MAEFSFDEKVAILSLASGVMFADDKAKMSERRSFEKIQKQLDLTIPVSLLTVDEAVRQVSEFDRLSQLRILLMIQSVAMSDDQFDRYDRKMTSDIAEKLGVTFELPQESLETVMGLLYKFASVDGDILEEEKALLVKLLGDDETAYNHFVQNANSFNIEEAIKQIADMDEIDKSLIGFFIQQIITADDRIVEKESELIKKVFESTGIDELCIPEKTGFWKRIFG